MTGDDAGAVSQRTWHAALIDLYERAGRPTTRDISTEAGCLHTTVATALRGSRTPTPKTLKRIVKALGGDIHQFPYPTVAVRTPKVVAAELLREAREMRLLLEKIADAQTNSASGE